jgi:hypothetical protein
MNLEHMDEDTELESVASRMNQLRQAEEQQWLAF